jgi:hypothetical protein
LSLFCNEELRKILQNEKMTAPRDGEFVVFLISRLSTKPLAAERQGQVEWRLTRVSQPMD